MATSGTEFDDANPLYLVSVDPDTEEYWGSLRLLPTTGPNMLRDVFPQLLDGDYHRERHDLGVFAHLLRGRARPAGTKRQRRQLRPERAHFGHRRSCGRSRLDPNRGRLRRQNLSRPKAAGCNPRSSGRPNRSARSCATPAFSTPARVPQSVSRGDRRSTTRCLRPEPERLHSPEEAWARRAIRSGFSHQDVRFRFATHK